MKIIAIGGVPATGKTTLMRCVIDKYFSQKESKRFKWKTIVGVHDPSTKNIIIGVYDTGMFSGTDRLSMQAPRDFKIWLTKLKDKDVNIFFEGDRLFTASVLKFIDELKIDRYFLRLNVCKKSRDFRAKERSDTQTDQFIKGRYTKLDNIEKEISIESWDHENENDTNEILKSFERFLKKGKKKATRRRPKKLDE